MPIDTTNPAEESEAVKPNENLVNEGPIDERDEVKQAEERTRQLQKEAEDPSQSTKDTDK
jgi:hypothetical protein